MAAFKSGWRLTIGRRLMLGVITIVIAAIGLQIWVNQTRAHKWINQTQDAQLKTLYENFVRSVQAEARTATLLSDLVAQMPQAQQAFAAQDRQALLEMFRQPFLEMKEKYGMAQFQFHLPPATSFLRLHKPEKFGDDLSSFRQTVVQTNQTRQTVCGVEAGVGGLGIRGVTPVFNGEQHLGSVEFGQGLSQPFFDIFKEQNHADVALYLPGQEGFKTLASTVGDQPLVSQDVLERIWQDKQIYLQELPWQGRSSALCVGTLLDFSSQPVGLVAVLMDVTQYDQALSQARWTALGVGALVLAGAIFFTWLLGRSICRPMKTLIKRMHAVASGEADLTQRLNFTRNDELGELAGCFDAFVKRIHDMIVDVKQATDAVGLASSQIDHVSSQIVERIDEQTQQVTQIAATIHQITASAVDVAHQSEQAAQQAQCSGDLAQQGGQSVHRTVGEIDRISQSVSASAADLQALNTRVDAIRQVISVITDIADQTNLLALNAAIEAARAGDSGRGFAVVADEVRKLADRTTQATGEVSSTVKAILEHTQVVVQKMDDGARQVGTGVECAHEAGQRLSGILESTQQVSSRIEQIAASVREQSQATEQIGLAINQIEQINQNTQHGVQEAELSSRELNQNVQRLRSVIAQFVVAES